MSFILDALKKSENERQQQASAEFAAIPSAPAPAGAPRWIWVLGALLSVNLIAVAATLLWKDDPVPVSTAAPAASSVPVAGTAPAAARTSTPDSSSSGFAERLNLAPRREPPPAATTPAAAAGSVEQPQQPVRDASPLALPTLTEIRLREGSDLPDLRLDIHVFSTIPENRFVFINMQKYQEGSVLDAGPRLLEITANGVVMDHRGTRFMLPRE
ncbi:MAG: general secretion pathway protein GspB [Pseudomonadota bacterium]